MQIKTSVCISGLLTALLMQPSAHAQTPLTAARDLYAAAAYDDALKILDVLATDGLAGDREAAGIYRALCLFAVGRANEGNAVIDAIIQDNPLYHPPADDMPPRMQVAFTAARRRLLPMIVQQEYHVAKSAFDRQDYATASAMFTQVLDTLSDADVNAVASQPPLADLRTLALGFRTLSDTAAPPPPAPVPAAAPPVKILSIYTGEEPGVIPPVVVRQELPPFVGRVTSPRSGVVEVVVNERGTVDAARMGTPVDPSYDDRVLSAAKKWVYKPATVDGTPVKFLRRVRVVLRQSQPPSQ